MKFLGQNYLLENSTAEELYQSIASLPIVDAHNHSDLKEILANENWHDIWQLEAASDHYVWELMRKRGIPESKITGSASNKEKWFALAEIFPELAGNPTYEWIHLDLKRQLGIEENISAETANYIWQVSKQKLAKTEFKPQKILKKMQVEVMCTTDDVFSLLKDHQRLHKEINSPQILPTWRTDKIMNIEQPEWLESVEKLAMNYQQDVADLTGLLKALQKSHDHFNKLGCVSGDHGIAAPVSYPVTFSQAETVYKSALLGKKLAQSEINDFKSFILIEFGKMNQLTNWVTQLHIGTLRNYRDSLTTKYNLTEGMDISNYQVEIASNLRYFFNYFDNKLPIVIYTMEPAHWFTASTISRAFPNVYLGAAWWYADSPYGMEKQLEQVSTVDLFYNLAGMVTDSRKILSYSSRTEMFRRSLANVVANQVEKGKIPNDVAVDLVSWLSYFGPKKLFFS